MGEPRILVILIFSGLYSGTLERIVFEVVVVCDVETGLCGECDALSEPQPRILGRQLIGGDDMYSLQSRKDV